MAPLTSVLLATAVLAMQASAATMKVTVGQGGTLAFNPSEVKAAVGDVVEFDFAAGGNHSVVMGDFANACQPAKTGGFFSGYMTNANTFSITVTTTDPIPFYCSQTLPPHCPFGMVGVINPSGSNTQASFATSAKNAKEVGAPANVFGGTVNGSPPSSGGSSSSSGSSAAAAPTTTPASGGGGGGLYGGGGSAPTTSAAGGASPTPAPAGSGAGSIGAPLGAIVAAIGFALYMA